MLSAGAAVGAARTAASVRVAYTKPCRVQRYHQEIERYIMTVYKTSDVTNSSTSPSESRQQPSSSRVTVLALTDNVFRRSLTRWRAAIGHNMAVALAIDEL